MIRITKINIKNYRVYKEQLFKFDGGKNLLIYGENGSGKSSLFNALKDFFTSSVNPSIIFNVNKYLPSQEGSIEIEFNNINSEQSGLSESENISEKLIYCSDKDKSSNNQSNYIRESLFVNGFLDYTDLLKVYFHDDSRPNLFNLIVLTLLGDHTPTTRGMTKSIKDTYDDIYHGLFNSHNRNTKKHKSSLLKLRHFNIQLRSYLDDIFTLLNNFLSAYFVDFNMQLAYELDEFTLTYGKVKKNWHLHTVLKLKVTYSSIEISDDYCNILNEAKLSAISVCLYLAALKINDSNVNFKLLFLDDVFLGLDSANRLPILNILKTEFPNYQKIISTYDRQWFELAKQFFSNNENNLWKYVEMYIADDSDNKGIKPILIEGISYIDKASSYLHHCISPDYPAAANYIRKALEQLISNNLPSEEMRDDEYIQIPSYKLSKLIKIFVRLIERLNITCSSIEQINSLLHCILHPLSHHEIDAPIYKNELLLLEKSYSNLKSNLESWNLISKIKCVLESGNIIRLKLKVNNEYNYYEIVLKENLLVYRDSIVDIKLVLKEMYKLQGNNKFKKYSPNKKLQKFSYTSIENAIQKISQYLSKNTSINVIYNRDKIEENYEYLEKGEWFKLTSKLY